MDDSADLPQWLAQFECRCRGSNICAPSPSDLVAQCVLTVSGGILLGTVCAGGFWWYGMLLGTTCAYMYIIVHSEHNVHASCFPFSWHEHGDMLCASEPHIHHMLSQKVACTACMDSDGLMHMCCQTPLVAVACAACMAVEPIDAYVLPNTCSGTPSCLCTMTSEVQIRV